MCVVVLVLACRHVCAVVVVVAVLVVLVVVVVRKALVINLSYTIPRPRRLNRSAAEKLLVGRRVVNS